jgi:hypothetical protein
MIEQKIDVMVHSLPLNLKKEVLDYVEFLLYKYPEQPKTASEKKFKFDWEGGLADIKDKMTSVELQHKAMDWR